MVVFVLKQMPGLVFLQPMLNVKDLNQFSVR